MQDDPRFGEDTDQQTDDPSWGYVFAATGERHRILARKAARSLRQVSPEVAIDFFTDAPLDDDVFDKIHLIETATHRPKIEALRRSRFERTVYLDNDIISLCDATEMFALFEKADVIGVHDNNRNSKNALAQVGNTVPASFPSINSGVLGIKKTPATQRLLTAWWFRMRKNQHQVDQPALRSLLWERNIKLAILPIEYNLMAVKVIGILSRQMTAPRFLHLRQLNKNQRDVGDPMTPHDVADVLSLASCHRLLRALQNDNTIAPPFGVSARRGTRLFRRYLGWKDRLRSRLLFRWSFQRQASLARRKQKPPQRPCKDAGRKT